MAELGGCFSDSCRCYCTESFWKGNPEACFDTDRYSRRICGVDSFWNGKSFKCWRSKSISASTVYAFGIHFEISACVAIGLLFAINSVQAIGDYSATTIGAMDRVPEDRELQNGIMAYGVTNILGALLGGLPTATYSQNVGIVTTTKVINRWVLGLAAAILGVAGIVPKFSALLTTIPQCVLGGATVSVFASIAMTGMKLVASAEMDYRNSSIVGLAAAIGVGVSQASAALASFPDWVTTIFGKSPVVLATLIAVVLNIILPKSRDEKKSRKRIKERSKRKDPAGS